MVDKKQTPSVEEYNRWSRLYSVQQDDGDQIPTGRDAFINKAGQEVPFDKVVTNLIDYYQAVVPEAVATFRGDKSFYRCVYYTTFSGLNFHNCSENKDWPVDWFLQFQELKDILPAGALDVHAPTGELFFGSPFYFLGVWFSYQKNEEIQKFVEFLRSTQISLLGLQVMERTAKGRGNIELGKQIHTIFEERNPDKMFVRLPFKDDWGDTIYLERGSSSEKAWQQAQSILSTEKEQEEFAKTLGYFVEVEIVGKTWLETLKKFSQEIPLYYTQGIPVPAKLKIGIDSSRSHRLLPPGGRYSATHVGIMPTIEMSHSWGDGTYAHELGHFFFDLMNDTEGLNIGYYVQQRKDGSLLFDPNDCNENNSVTSYGGRCNAQRQGLLLADTDKQYEEPAETFAWVLQERIGREYRPDGDDWLSRAEDFVISVEEHFLQATLYLYMEGSLSEWFKRDLVIYDPIIKMCGIPPSHKENDETYLKELGSWLNEAKKILRRTRQLRQEKIDWMTDIISRLQTPSLTRPDPKTPPHIVVAQKQKP